MPPRVTIKKAKPLSKSHWERFGKLTYWEEDDNFIWIYSDQGKDNYLKYKKTSNIAKGGVVPERILNEIRNKLRYLDGMDCAVMKRTSENPSYDENLRPLFWDITLDDQEKVQKIKQVMGEEEVKLQESVDTLAKKVQENRKNLKNRRHLRSKKVQDEILASIKQTRLKLIDIENELAFVQEDMDELDGSRSTRLIMRLQRERDELYANLERLNFQQADLNKEERIEIARQNDEVQHLEAELSKANEKLDELRSITSPYEKLKIPQRKTIKLPVIKTESKRKHEEQKKSLLTGVAASRHDPNNNAQFTREQNLEYDVDKLQKSYARVEANLQKARASIKELNARIVDLEADKDALQRQNQQEQIATLKAEKEAMKLERDMANLQSSFEAQLRDAFNSLNTTEADNEALLNRIKNGYEPEDKERVRKDIAHYKVHKVDLLGTTTGILIRGVENSHARSCLALRAGVNIPDSQGEINCQFINHKGGNVFLVRLVDFDVITIAVLHFDGKDNILTTCEFDHQDWPKKEHQIAGTNANRRKDVARQQFIEWHKQIKTSLGL